MKYRLLKALLSVLLIFGAAPNTAVLHAEEAETADTVQETQEEETETVSAEEESAEDAVLSDAETITETAEEEVPEQVNEEPAAETVAEEPVTEQVPEEKVTEQIPAEETEAEVVEETPAEVTEETAEPEAQAEEAELPEEEMPAEDTETEAVEEVTVEEADEEPGEEEIIETVDASDSILQSGAFFKPEENIGEIAYSIMSTQSVLSEGTAIVYDPDRDFASLNQAFREVAGSWGTVLDVSAYNIPREEASHVYSSLVNSNPQFFYLSASFSLSQKNGVLTKLMFNFDEGYDTASVELFNGVVNTITAEVDPNWSEEQKALYLHDRLVLHNTYDQSLTKHDAFHALVERTSVCQGYALAYKYLLEQVGVESFLITSSALNHAWNMVTINGAKYYVDCTWDDPSNMFRKYCRHTNFLRSQEGMVSTNHTSDDWLDVFGRTIYGTECLTDYAGSYWRDTTTRIPHIGDLWAYTNSKQTNLYVHDYASGTDRVLTDQLNTKWDVMGSSSTYADYFVSLDTYQSYFIASQPKSIVLIDTLGMISSLGTISAEEEAQGRIYGIERNGENVSYDLNSSYKLADYISSNTMSLESYNICRDGHDYKFDKWTWADDLSSAEAHYICQNDPKHTTSLQVIPEEAYTAPQCEEDGTSIYTVSLNAAESPDGEDHSDSRTVTHAATGHDYGDPEYTWTKTSGGYDVTAEMVCQNDPSHVISETITANYSVVRETDCEIAGEGLYVAEFTNENFYAQSKTVEIPATGHSYHFLDMIWYGAPDGTWSAVGVYVCDHNSEHRLEVNAPVYEEIRQPTCERVGFHIYTASINRDTSPTGHWNEDTRSDEIPALGHQYTLDTWEWSEDLSEAHAVFRCEHDASHTADVQADVTVTTVEAKCEEEGIEYYDAVISAENAPDHQEHTDQQYAVLMEAGHDYELKEVRWSDDYSSAEADLVCRRDPAHTLTEQAEVSSREDDGKLICTAAFTADGQPFVSYREFIIPTAPVMLEAVNTAEGITLSWQTVADAEDYAVYFKNNGTWLKLGNTGGAEIVSGNTVYYTVKDFADECGYEHTFTVQALNGPAVSGYDQEGVSVLRLQAPVVHAENKGGGSAVVSWDAMVTDSYELSYRVKGGEWTVEPYADVVKELTGLDSGTYTFRVRCVMAAPDGTVNYSAYSDEVSVTVTEAPLVNGLYYLGGVWKYYENGIFTEATGLVQRPDNKKWYYVENGVYKKATGLAMRVDNKKWYYVQNGAYTKLTGVVRRIDNGKWFYVENGVYVKKTGLAQRPDNRNWYYIQNGAYSNKVTGLVARIDNGRWFYVEKGVYTKKTGLTQRPDNKKWYYVLNGAYTKWTGVVPRITDGKPFYVKSGVYDTTYSGQAKDAAGNAYKVTNGRAVKL